jgi:hypothetical protein
MVTRIEVTRDDIEHGRKGDCIACPVARAISRTLDAPCTVSHEAWIYGRSRCLCDPIRVELPHAVEDFIDAFDVGERVEPVSFDLDIPEELLKKEGP